MKIITSAEIEREIERERKYTLATTTTVLDFLIIL